MTIFSSLEGMFVSIFQSKEGDEQVDAFMRMICKLTVPRLIFLSRYKKIAPIEEMPEYEKKEMKKYVLSLFPEKSTQEKLECCKIIYTFGTLL